MKSPAMGVKRFVVACAWIVVSLTVAERALGAPQSGDSEKQDTKKQDTEKPAGDEGTAKAKGDGKTKTAQDSSTLDKEPLVNSALASYRFRKRFCAGSKTNLDQSSSSPFLGH